MKNISLLIKPASSLCNMRCKYCFYYDVADNRDTQSFGIMDTKTTDLLIEQVFEYIGHNGVINFAFQGGEPTLAGLDFFRYFTSKVDQLKTNKVQVNYSIQTNGQLVDDDFCKLFKEYRFLVGLSQDGPSNFHDVNRLDNKLGPTHANTNKALQTMKKHGVEFNILSVVTKQMARKPKTLFNYYVKNKIRYIQLIPCLNPLDESSIIRGDSDQDTSITEGTDIDSRSKRVQEFTKDIKKYELTPRDYGSFLTDFFNLWYEEFMNGNYISVRMFDNLIHMLKGRGPEQCGMLGTCNLQCIVESDGSIYPCDFYVLDEFKLGNIHEEKFVDIYQPSRAKAFFDYEEAKHPLCDTCKVYPICTGGCKRYRSFYSREEDYCPYQDFLYNSFDKMQEVARVVG